MRTLAAVMHEPGALVVEEVGEAGGRSGIDPGRAEEVLGDAEPAAAADDDDALAARLAGIETDALYALNPGETLALVGPSGAGKTAIYQVAGQLLDGTRSMDELTDDLFDRILRIAPLAALADQIAALASHRTHIAPGINGHERGDRHRTTPSSSHGCSKRKKAARARPPSSGRRYSCEWRVVQINP